MDKVFVTGAGGFIGRHLVAALLTKGKQVTALMLPGEAIPSQWGGQVKIVTGDVRHLMSVAEDIGGGDTIFHLAAVVSDWGARQEHVEITVHGTQQAIELALKNRARLVVTTSIAAFGSSLGTGVVNERTARGESSSNYEYAKQLQEDVTLAAVHSSGLNAVIIRPANVYGPGSVWVKRFVQKLSEKQPVLMGSGNWDAGLVHVHHVVQSLILAAEHTKLPSGEIFVIADDPGVTWKSYMDALSYTLNLPAAKRIPNLVARVLAPVLEFFGRLVGQKTPPLITRLAYRLIGKETIFNSDKAKQMLGYRPTISLEQAMQEIKQHNQAS